MKLQSILLLAIALLFSCKDDDKNGMSTPVSLSSQDLTVEEGDNSKPVYVNLQLSSAAAGIVVLNVKTIDGSAKAGEDYIAIQNQQVTFNEGQLSQSVRLDILGDDIPESDEEFTLAMSDISGAVLGTSSITVIIENDDLSTEFMIPGSGYSTPESYPGMTLIWQDEFDGTEPNSNNWTFETGNGSSGWGNNELQYYRRENTFMRDGHLVIEARDEPWGGFQYTSSRMITRGKFEFQYGRVDIRAALPQGQGLWPALWMLGSNIGQVGWPSCGEVDIMEMIGGGPGRDDTVHGTIHWSQGGSHAYHGDGITIPSSDSFKDRFHVFSIRWDDQQIRWYLDDVLFHSEFITSSEMTEFHDQFFFIFNVAVGGNWPGSPNASTVFPQRMIVDYIRVFHDK